MEIAVIIFSVAASGLVALLGYIVLRQRKSIQDLDLEVRIKESSSKEYRDFADEYQRKYASSQNELERYKERFLPKKPEAVADHRFPFIPYIDELYENLRHDPNFMPSHNKFAHLDERTEEEKRNDEKRKWLNIMKSNFVLCAETIKQEIDRNTELNNGCFVQTEYIRGLLFGLRLFEGNENIYDKAMHRQIIRQQSK